MKLSAEHFAELAASFGAREATETKHNRRRAARLELDASVNVRLVDCDRTPNAFNVTVLDFSSRGMAALLPRSVNPGQQIVADIPRKTGGTVSLLCTVVHCVPRDEQFKIGVEFTCVLKGPIAAPHPDAEAIKRIRQSVLQ